MEHPLVANIDSLNVDELTAKISELNQKLAIAAQTGNGHLCNQIRMVIESYQNKFQEKIKKQYEENKEFNQKIKIS